MHSLVVHHVISDLGPDRFDQLPRGSGDDLGRPRSQPHVVIGVGQVVAVGGLGQVYPHGDIDDKPLPGHSLVVVDPVPTMHGQAAQFDSVSHRVLSFPLPSTLRPP